jgi:hypothetical protein
VWTWFIGAEEALAFKCIIIITQDIDGPTQKGFMWMCLLAGGERTFQNSEEEGVADFRCFNFYYSFSVWLLGK